MYVREEGQNDVITQLHIESILQLRKNLQTVIVPHTTVFLKLSLCTHYPQLQLKELKLYAEKMETIFTKSYPFDDFLAISNAERQTT